MYVFFRADKVLVITMVLVESYRWFLLKTSRKKGNLKTYFNLREFLIQVKNAVLKFLKHFNF